MNTDLIIFQEEQFHFGIYPHEFDNQFSLNSAWISPNEETDQLWNFKRMNEPFEGRFTHIGSLLGLTSAYFNSSSQIFMKQLPDDTSLGLCISSTIFRISLKKNHEKYMEADEFGDFPDDLSKTVFSKIVYYKRKEIFVIDPLLLFRANKFLFSPD